MNEQEAKYWRRYARVTAFGLGIVNPPDLEDVAQDCLVSCILAYNRPTGSRDAYLGRVCRNRCLQWLDRESRRKHESIEAYWSYDGDEPRDLQDMRALTDSDIAAYLSADDYLALSDEVDARIIRLLAEGNSEREIAKSLGLTVTQAKQAIADIQRDAISVYELGDSCKSNYQESQNS